MLEGAGINKANIVRAVEMVAMLHGHEYLGKIHENIQTMFTNGGEAIALNSNRLLVAMSIDIW